MAEGKGLCSYSLHYCAVAQRQSYVGRAEGALVVKNVKVELQEGDEPHRTKVRIEREGGYACVLNRLRIRGQRI